MSAPRVASLSSYFHLTLCMVLGAMYGTRPSWGVEGTPPPHVPSSTVAAHDVSGTSTGHPSTMVACPRLALAVVLLLVLVVGKLRHGHVDIVVVMCTPDSRWWWVAYVSTDSSSTRKGAILVLMALPLFVSIMLFLWSWHLLGWRCSCSYDRCGLYGRGSSSKSALVEKDSTPAGRYIFIDWSGYPSTVLFLVAVF